MKKTQSKLPDPRKTEVLDSAKRQYRIVAEASRQLEEKQRRVQTCAELFQPDLIARRARLAELCERLALGEPSLFGRNAEELLWKKTLYDVFSTAKRLRKNNCWSSSEKAYVERHLFAGLGSYHALVLRLQTEFQLDLRGVYDLPHCFGDGSLFNNSNSSRRSREQGGKEWALQAVHRCLVAMGDLTRYLVDITSVCTAEQAARFYLQAACIEPKAGMPYNQLGTLSGTQNNCLNGAFYYMRCLASEQSFDGAEGNLQRLMERNAALLLSGHAPSNPVEHVRCCVARLLMLADSWFFNRSMASGKEEVCSETLNDIQQCLAYPRPQPIGDVDTSEIVIKKEAPAFLDDDALFRIVAIVLLCISSLKRKNSSMLDVAVRFTLGLLGNVTQRLLSLLQQEVEEPPNNEHAITNNGQTKQKKNKKKLKLRRRRRNSSEDESDLSQGEDGSGDSSSEADSDVSEPEESSSSEEEEEEEDNEEETKASDKHATKETSAMSVISSQQGLLVATKLCCDWLRGDETTLLACSKSSRSLLEQVIKLLNLVANAAATARSVGSKEDLLKISEVVPMPEDLATRGIAVMSTAHENLNWQYWRLKKLHSHDEKLLRMYKLVNFGHFLTGVSGVGVTFDTSSGVFCVIQDVATIKQQTSNEAPSKDTPTNGSESQRQLMRDMGQLWLQEEVRDLESRVRKSECNFSPYLVVDREALLQHMHLVKQLVFSKKFVVIIPCVVVSALDELKGDSGRAREAIRWLETQFQRGNRFLRAQRSNESLTLPLIKYPKKKDKEAWVFFKVLECCSHLAQHAAAGTSHPQGSALVSLLTGTQIDSDPSRDFSPQGLAQSAGIKLESISSFCAKLKSSSKSHG